MTEKHNSKGNEMLRVGPVVGPDGTRVALRHHSDHTLEQVFVQPIKEGQALSNETVLSLSHRQGDLYDIVDSYEPLRSGPSQVATKSYRAGWDRIFGGSSVVGQA